MSVGLGSKSELVYGIESAYGVFPSTPAGVALGLLSENIQNTRNTFISDEVNAARVVTSIRTGNVQAGGPIATELSPNALGQFWKHLLMCVPVTTTVTGTALANSQAATRGAYFSHGGNLYLCIKSGTSAGSAALVTTDYSEEVSGTATYMYAGAAGSIYKHVFQAGNTKPTGGIWVERNSFLDTGSEFFRYIGGRIQSASLNLPQEGILTANWDMVFLDLDSQSNATLTGSITRPEDEPFAGSQSMIRLKVGAGAYAEDASVSAFTMNIANGFDTNIYAVGARRRRDLPEGRREVNASIQCYFEDITKFNYFKNETLFSTEFTTYNRGQFMLIEMPQGRFQGGQPTPVIAGNGVTSTSFDLTAFGTNDIKLELYNTTASYA